MLKAIKSWLQFNGIETRRKIKIKGATNTPSLKEERVPTKEELAYPPQFLTKNLKEKLLMSLSIFKLHGQKSLNTFIPIM